MAASLSILGSSKSGMAIASTASEVKWDYEYMGLWYIVRKVTYVVLGEPLLGVCKICALLFFKRHSREPIVSEQRIETDFLIRFPLYIICGEIRGFRAIQFSFFLPYGQISEREVPPAVRNGPIDWN